MIFKYKKTSALFLDMTSKIGIIGGAGAMGSYFAELFRDAKYHVSVSDIHEERLERIKNRGYETASSEELAYSSDLLVFSVPLLNTPGVIRQYAPLVRGEEKGISDLTSTKVPAIRAMVESSNPEVEIIGMHPMFGPAVSMEGQNVVLTPIRPESGGVWRERLEHLIKSNGASYFHTTPEEHDHYMSLVQGLPHALQFIAAETFRRLDVDLETLARFSSRFYEMFFNVLWRVFGANNPELYGQIQMGNPENRGVLSVLEKVAREYARLIDRGTMKEFTEIYDGGRLFLGPYAELAERKTAQLVGRPVGVPLYYLREDEAAIESTIGEMLIASPYKEDLSIARVRQRELGKIIRNFPFARYTEFRRSELQPDGTRVQSREGTYAFYISNKKHPEEPKKGVMFSPIVQLQPEKTEMRHPHHVRVQMRNVYADPYLNLYHTWNEHTELHSMGILIAGQTREKTR